MKKIKEKVISNENPWVINLEERIKMISDAKSENKKVVLSIYKTVDNSTFRYRGYNIMKSLLKSDEWFNMYFFEDEIDHAIELVDIAEFVVIIRCMWSLNLDKMINKVKIQNKKIVFDIDDYVCDINQINLVANTLNQDLNDEGGLSYWFSYSARLEYTASKADHFISTNKFLANKLENKFKKPCSIIINSLNDEQLDMSEYCVKQKNRTSSDKSFVLGYFSGSPSHINDFNSISNELIELLEKYENIKIKIVGYLELSSKFKKYSKQGRIILHPFVNFIDLQRLMAQVDVNIVPLINNEFTNCKSELKFFEASAVHTITVATPIYTYSNSIEHKKTGFLANQGEWVDIISDIYEGKYDINQILDAAHDYCIKKYSGKKFMKNIESTYNEILNK